jgi:hypothetical protein
MKRMLWLSLIFIFGCVLLLPDVSLAKGEMAVGGGLELALPTGNFGDAAGMGFGASGRFEYVFTPNITFTGTLGYIKWGGKDVGIYEFSYSHIPIKVGAKYYINPQLKNFYAGGELGLNMFSWSWKGSGIIGYDPVTFQPIYGDVDESDSESRFGIVLMGGYEMPLGETLILDLSGRFEIISDANFIGFRVGVLYPLGAK